MAVDVAVALKYVHILQSSASGLALALAVGYKYVHVLIKRLRKRP